jgi:hypothetical protein
MKALLSIMVAGLLCIGTASADENYIGAWASGAKEVLQISRDGDTLTAEFVRENVKSEFEKIRFPAKVADGALVITGEQGNLSGRYDAGNKLLILGGMKTFQKLTAAQAQQLIADLERNR